MKTEDKELLLKDLCTRLPYSETWVQYDGKDYVVTGYGHGRVSLLSSPFSSAVGPCPLVEEVKPYLRPMSSMTKAEKEEYEKMIAWGSFDWEMVDFYNEHHLNYRLPPHLFIEAPEGMYNKEESEKESEVPIPKTVDEAVKILAKTLSKEDRDYILENGAISVHHSLGTWIRNEWGLWTDSELKNELKKKGFEHPDDMSNYIIEEFIKYWNNKL